MIRPPYRAMYQRLLGLARLLLIQVCTLFPHPVLGKMLEMRRGRYRTEAAKMMGTTPPVFTFMGMYVLWPPYMRRPTTRLAKVTGMRRWPCSMNTMATRSTRDSTMMKANLNSPASALIDAPPDGMVDTTLVN